MTARIGVLFVCLGNICRSPLAKFVFADLVTRRRVADRFAIDSCGTGAWHAGEGADPRTEAVARKYGLDVAHRARQLRPHVDFDHFHYLIGMDLDNHRRLLETGAPSDRVFLLRSFDPELAGRPHHEIIVPDPYYGGEDGFEKMYHMVRAGCEGLLEHALARHG
ncbi:MAG: protein-tyrosine-phosphatase [Phycisphaerae bacterium]|nr:MAG: protein-tyrosine-phosphatase [Phycisphaerae bacterium]